MLQNSIFLLFLIIALGYLLGSIRIKGMHLGSAGILLVALVFGHFGYELPSIVQNLGLILFVTSVGFLAGPEFFTHFRGGAKAYVFTGAVIIITGVLTALLVIYGFGVSPDLALGLLTGALTTTPGLGAAIEATGSDLVSVGYGIAYPFGVISVVLFVQFVPKILHVDMEKERQELAKQNVGSKEIGGEKAIRFDKQGLFAVAVAVLFGLLIGTITIPLPGGASFSLGSSGGPLIAGILIGHFRKIGPIDLKVPGTTLTALRELGLAFFLAGAGTHAGSGFVEVLVQNGAMLFVYGAIMALAPEIIGFVFAYKLFHLEILDTLGTVCGGMTSTPALGTLISSAGTDDVTVSYAVTYPVALALIVILTQLVGTMCK